MMPGQSNDVVFAVIGDVEPKPHPNFDQFRQSIEACNILADKSDLQCVFSIGDLAHKGRDDHFDAVTNIVQRLCVPFYAIMGNEELMAGEDTFFDYASKWNDDAQAIPAARYVVQQGNITFILASALSGGVTFDDEEGAWIAERVNEARGPVVLITHAPAPNVFPEAGKRAMQNELLTPVLQHPHVVMHFSGHTHFDLSTVEGYVVDRYGVHHVHVPGIERTKVGRLHTPRFRIVRIDASGHVTIETYNVQKNDIDDSLRIQFHIDRSALAR